MIEPLSAYKCERKQRDIKQEVQNRENDRDRKWAFITDERPERRRERNDKCLSASPYNLKILERKHIYTQNLIL